MFETIDDLKKKLDQHRPLSPSIVKNLQEDLIVRWTYHSNACLLYTSDAADE